MAAASGKQPFFRRFHSGPASAAAYSMAKVRLGSKEFNVDSEHIDASNCDVTAADLALFAARVKTGEISRLKILWLVIFFPVLFLLCIFRLLFAALRQRRLSAAEFSFLFFIVVRER